MRLFLADEPGKSKSTGEKMVRTSSGTNWVAVY
jgi:hypothetical protein